MSHDDRALLNRWVDQRDPEAFKTIANRYAQMVYATARRILGDDGQAEEVAQDCFLALIRSGAKPAPYLGPWLHRVATNLSLKRIRTDARRKKRETAYQTSPASTSDTEIAEAMTYVDEAIAKLPGDQRDAVIAYFLENQTHEAIANATGITRQGVAYRIQRGIESIRKQLDRKGINLSAATLSAALAINDASAVPPQLSANLGRLALSGAGHAAKSSLRAKGLAIVAAIAFLIAAGITYLRTTADPPEPTNLAGTPSPAPQAFDDSETTADEHSVSHLAVSISSDEVPSSETDADPAVAIQPQSDESLADLDVFVVDSRGFPVQGATIVVYDNDPGFNILGAEGAPRIETANSDGHARFTRLQQRNAVFISVSAPEFQTTSKRESLGRAIALESQRVTAAARPIVSTSLVLHDGFSLIGDVLTPEGDPVPNAIVRPLGAVSERGYGSGGQDVYNIVLSDDDGHFETGFNHAGEVALKITAANGMAKIFTNVPVATGETIEFILDEPAALTGTIKNADASPAAQLNIALAGRFTMSTESFNQNQPIDGETDYLATLTDSNGNYAFQNLPTNAYYVIQARTESGKPLSSEFNLGTFDPGDRQSWNHTLESAIRVYGTVTGEETGAPINNVRIAYMQDDALYEGPYIYTGESYELRLFEAGDYYIFPEYNGHTRELMRESHGVTLQLAPGDERELNFKLPDQFSMTVRVVDQGGAPIPAADCEYYRITPEGRGMYGAGNTDGEGRHTHRFVPEFESWFYVKHSGYTAAHSTHITGEPAADYPEETVVLYPVSGIEGIAVSPDGLPLANAELKISLRAPGLKYSVNGFVQVDTIQVSADANGWFAVAEVLPATMGNIEIDIHLENNEWHRAATVSNIECLPNQVTDLGTIRFDLP